MIGKGVKGLCQEMTFDDPGTSKDCARKMAHTEKVVNGSERVNETINGAVCLKSLNGIQEFYFSLDFHQLMKVTILVKLSNSKMYFET
jgi:hypothetical protein